ncbi:UDP-glucose/GDP-mannose dehydrogenase family protein [Tessaracoccus sp. MC1679]|uniref:UDP-glucose dehydrogenase family protein n=1 Tax=Tessaracoccus sp. MC1679 TaxID=2760313 RepID=UPI001601CAE4|nr:UDP-glucose/GDP-mannose dehydrogenase family protein [Tessaracoccus sp. MC1679]MBB1515349.1 UDP-glucose/GDP-mannose dehydrogenase family protein [Tessaracoccus sp. MC1679]
MRISVIGCGYLGAVHAACMAELGHDVVGLDVDEAKVALLAQGKPSFHEPDFPELLARHVASGRLRFTTDPAQIRDAEIHFIGVGTPQLQGRLGADMTYVRQAVQTIVEHAEAPAGGRPVLVAGKSTVPVGTAQEIEVALAESGKNLLLAWNPEFLREGYAVADTLHPDRLVYGLPDDLARGAVAKEILDECYAGPLTEGTPLVVANYPTAELVKVAANSFLATKISFINAMAELCDATGGDVTRLAEAIGHDDRIGKKFLQAGIGFGGGCLPKDIRAFMARAGELGVDEALTFLREVDAINRRRRDHAVSLAEQAVGGRLAGKKVAVLGITFKPDTDDLRDSPALDIAGRLWSRGAELAVVDPAAGDLLRERQPELNVSDTVDEAVRDAHVVMVLTQWREFVELDPAALVSLPASPNVIDGRNVLNPRRWSDAGWHYYGMGRGVSIW